MAYQSLYRRYRPRRFEEVRGQEHVVGALRNAIRNDSVTHAYLFSGPRGTGKTSTARILAKALNCENLQNGEPCCDCTPCQDMEAGRSFDLFELDAASNNGVDAIRDLIERTAVGSPGRTKVYILDEVHMLSPAAANALLKTLEEPPDHVRFVLATTDPQKVLPTIRSRTQHFEFQLLSADELERYVRWISNDAQLDVDDASVAWSVRQGRGSARDTLSALDQVVAAGGVVDRSEPVEKLFEALADKNSGVAIQAVADALDQGHDIRVLAKAFLDDLRDTFLISLGAEVPHMMAEDAQVTAGWAAKLGTPLLTRAMEAVGSSIVDMRQAADPRVPFEVALVRLTTAAAGSLNELSERIEKLERALASGAAPSPTAGSVTGSPRSAATKSAPTARAATESSPTRSDAAESGQRRSDTAEPGQGGSDAADQSGTRSGGEAPLSGPARARAERARQKAEQGGSGADSGPKTNRARPSASSKPPGAAPPVPPSASRPAPDDSRGAQTPPVPPSAARPAEAESDPVPVPADPPSTSSSEPVGASGSGDSGSDDSGSDDSTAVPSPIGPEPQAGATGPADDGSSGADGPPPVDSESTAQAPPASNSGSMSATDEVAELQSAMETVVVPNIRGVAKAIYSQGRFVALEAGVAVFAVENAPTRDRAEKSRTEVEGLLSAELGRNVSIRVLDNESAAHLIGTGPPGANSTNDQRGAGSFRQSGTLDNEAAGLDGQDGLEDDDEDLTTIDIAQLEDAKGIAETGLDRLIKAFPGATLVESKEEQK